VLFDAKSLAESCEAPITIPHIVNEIALTCKDECFGTLRKQLQKSKKTLEVVSVFETRYEKQAALTILLSNAVRVTFLIAPTRMTDSHLLDFTSDFRVVKIEASPFERT
jgi:hypothetical protein